MLRFRHHAALLALSLGLGACASDEEIVFPSIDPDILVEFCIMGEVPVQTTASESGTVTDDDCTEGFDDGFWEGWRVRVAEDRSYTIEISSGFDSWLDVYRLTDLDNIDDNTVVLVAEDDDGGDGFDARATVTLRPDTEYVVFVSGYDQNETGAYSLSIR
jgi:hypothetical protein